MTYYGLGRTCPSLFRGLAPFFHHSHKAPSKPTHNAGTSGYYRAAAIVFGVGTGYLVANYADRGLSVLWPNPKRGCVDFIGGFNSIV